MKVQRTLAIEEDVDVESPGVRLAINGDVDEASPAHVGRRG